MSYGVPTATTTTGRPVRRSAATRFRCAALTRAPSVVTTTTSADRARPAAAEIALDDGAVPVPDAVTFLTP